MDNDFSSESKEPSHWEIIQLLICWNQSIRFIEVRLSFQGILSKKFLLVFTLHADLDCLNLPSRRSRFLWLLHHAISQWWRVRKTRGCMTVLWLLLAPGTLQATSLQHFPDVSWIPQPQPQPKSPTDLLASQFTHYRAITSSFWLIGPTRLRKRPAFQRLERLFLSIWRI